MLDQLSRFSKCNLDIKAKGDLQIDEHHTVEDIGISLGLAFKKALGEKRGIERYGFQLLPMDEALAQVSLDWSGRSYLVWNVEFKESKIGNIESNLFEHFFKSFCESAKLTLNIKCEGENGHHMIEAVFKAFGKAIKQSIEVNSEEIPSTKGVI